NEKRDEYGSPRLQQLIINSHQLNAQEIVERIIDDVSTFQGAAPPHDDMTMLVMKRVS
ncbi:MAG: serine/threonine protein phosphatase, partial [Spirochaetales bacterium]